MKKIIMLAVMLGLTGGAYAAEVCVGALTCIQGPMGQPMPSGKHSPEFADLAVHASDLKTQAAEQEADIKPAAAEFEAVAGCRAVDNLFIMQPLMKDALRMLAPCLENIGFNTGGYVEAAAITLSGGKAAIKITTGDDDGAYELLLSALNKRNGKFFGYPVQLVKRY